MERSAAEELCDDSVPLKDAVGDVVVSVESRAVLLDDELKENAVEEELVWVELVRVVL